jgi:hypothetical protein
MPHIPDSIYAVFVIVILLIIAGVASWLQEVNPTLPWDNTRRVFEHKRSDRR